MLESILTVLQNSLFYLSCFTLVLTIVLLIYEHLTRDQNYWKRYGIQGPKPIAVLGNMHSYFIRSMPEVELEWYQKYGKLYGIFIGNKPALTVAEPDLLKLILVKDFNTFRNRVGGVNNHPVISKNLVSVRDDDWKRIRSIVSPTFSSGKLKKLQSLISECCDDFIESLDQYAAKSSEIDIKLHHGMYTMDVIARCAFGTNINAHKNPNNEFTANAKQCFDAKQWKLILLSLMPKALAKRTWIRRRLATTIMCEFFIDVGRHLIKQRKTNNISNSSKQVKDFLQLLIDAEISDSMMANESKDEVHHTFNFSQQQESDADQCENISNLSDTISQKSLTENEILAQCVVFFIAGYETTAATLAFCSYELALNAEIQQKLYEEIESAFSNDECNIDYDTLLKLPYLDSVICETLRKYPPGLRFDRTATNNYVLGDTGLTIPSGTLIEVPVYAIHYDPEYFPNPKQFNPERFMPENRSNIKPYTYLPFGTGPRNCIGMRFALLEAKLALVKIIRQFELFKSENTDLNLQYVKGRIILKSKRGVVIGIKRR